MIRRLAARALVVALAVLLPACGRDESEPVAVARAYAEASRRSDVAALLAVIDHDAVSEVERAAERASDQVGGRRAVEATEMLQISGVDRTLAVAEAKLVEQTELAAIVELTMTDGRTVPVHLVWEDDESEAGGAWKVRVPRPSVAASPVASQPDA